MLDAEQIRKMKEGVVRAKENFEIETANFLSEKSECFKSYFRAVPKTCKKLMLNAYLAKSSRSGAIKAKCLECSGFQREEIKDCRVEVCPLWAYRPFQKKKKLE